MRINLFSISINEPSTMPQIMNLRKALAAYAYRFLFCSYRALSPTQSVCQTERGTARPHY